MATDSAPVQKKEQIPAYEKDGFAYRYRWYRRTIVYGTLLSLGLLSWNYYQVKTAVDSIGSQGFSYSDPSGLAFKIKDLETNLGFLGTTGKFSWVISDDCKTETLFLADVNYKVSHLPWENNKVEMLITPNEKLVELSDGNVREIKATGRISKDGFVLPYKLPKTDFLSFSGSPVFTLNNGAEGFLRLSWGSTRVELESRGDLISFGSESGLEFRSFGAYMDLNPESNSTLVLGADKMKSQEVFVDKPSVQVRTSAYGFKGKRADYTLKSGDFSALGVYTKTVESSGSISVENWPEMKNVLSQIYKTCAGKKADEESRLRTRLSLNEVVRSGIALEVSDLFVDGESGPIRGRLEVEVQSEDIGRAADLHQALSVRGKVLLTPGVFAVDVLEQTRRSGALFLNNQGQYLGAFSYSDKKLKLNETDDAGAIDAGLFNVLRTANLDSGINQFYENLTLGISPFMELQGLYQKAPTPVGEIKNIVDSENVLKKPLDQGIIRRDINLVEKDGLSFSVRIPK